MKQYRKPIIIAAIVLLILAVAFWYGGNAPGLRGFSEQSPQSTAAETTEPTTAEATESVTEETQAVTEEMTTLATDAEATTAPTASAEEETASFATQSPEVTTSEVATAEATEEATDPDATEHPLPLDSANAVITDTEYSCTLSVVCGTILDNLSWLAKEKHSLVPQDGILFPEQTVSFYEGESVFHLLLRTMKQNRIHMEFTNTPLYDSAYIEAIGNLYEFDCGELSGWVYRVNGWFPNYGVSRYLLHPGDRVEFLYTCSHGEDVGGNNWGAVDTP